VCIIASRIISCLWFVYIAGGDGLALCFFWMIIIVLFYSSVSSWDGFLDTKGRNS
jgi:hypothetical protein